MSSDKMLARIGGLLRKAESTDNVHEAEAFMEAAQRLATSSAIDLAVARSHTASREKRAAPVQRMVRIGEPGKKGLRTYVQLFLAIARANDVQCDIAQSSAQVFAYGFDSDIDTCEALYASLIVQMVKASDAYIKSGEYRTATVQRVVIQTRGRRRYRVNEEKPLAGVTARLEFQLAFAVRIGERLGEAKKTAEVEAIEAAPEVGTALVLRNKEIELKDFYSSTSTARGTWRGQNASAGVSHGARRAGDRAGQAARLGGEPEIGRGSTQIGR